MEKNNPLACCLCKDKFQHPKILACLHSFCLVCLQKLQNNNKLEKRIQCPICHQTTELAKTGLDGLKINFFLSRLVDESTLLQTLQCAKVPCGLCSSGTAKSRCFDCAKFLCQDCQKIHNGIPSTFDHVILSLEDSRKVFQRDMDKPTHAQLKALKPRNDTLECPKHPGEKSRFFCQTCEDLICTDCMVIDHPTSSHSYTNLDDAAPGKRESAKNKMARLKLKLLDTDNFLQVLKVMSSERGRWANRAKTEVKFQAKLNREQVDKEEKRLLKEIRLESKKQMRQLKAAEFEVGTKVRHIHNSLQSGGVFVAESTDSEFLWLYSVLMKDLEHLEQLQLPSGPSALSFISTEIDISLGELQKIDVAEMITEEDELLKLKENTKLKPGKIGMSLPASSSDRSKPLAQKETTVLKKQVPELKQQTSDSSSNSLDSDTENTRSPTELSKTSSLLKPSSQPTGKQTEKTSSQQPNNSSAPKSSTSAEQERKIDTTSLSISTKPKPSSNPTGKPTEKISSQQSNNSSVPKPSSFSGPEKKNDTTSISINNVPKPSSNPTGKLPDKISSQQQSSSSPSAPKPSTAGARIKPAPLLASSDRVLRSSKKLNAIDESKGEEIARQALQTRTNQHHLQSSNGKATADQITSPLGRTVARLQSNLTNEEKVTPAFQPKSGKNNQKVVEKKDSVDSRMGRVQGGPREASQRRDETDSASPKEDGPQVLPAHQDDKSKSAHRWSSYGIDTDSDDSDL